MVLFALVFWYMMWGLPGAFLSVPIMSVLKILCLNMDNMTAQWFARLLGAPANSRRAQSARCQSACDAFNLCFNTPIALLCIVVIQRVTLRRRMTVRFSINFSIFHWVFIGFPLKPEEF